MLFLLEFEGGWDEPTNPYGFRIQDLTSFDSDSDNVDMRRSKFKPQEIEIRKTFPETWLFDSFDFDSE